MTVAVVLAIPPTLTDPGTNPPYPVKPVGTIDKQDLQDKSSPSYRPDWDLELGFGCWESPAANAPVGIQGRLE